MAAQTGAVQPDGLDGRVRTALPTGVKAMHQDLKYANAFDGNYNTRWLIGDTNSPAQTIGDQFTFDMKEAHVFKKIVFWSGGIGGAGGPDSRDYPGALDATVSLDGQTFGPPVGQRQRATARVHGRRAMQPALHH